MEYKKVPHVEISLFVALHFLLCGWSMEVVNSRKNTLFLHFLQKKIRKIVLFLLPKQELYGKIAVENKRVGRQPVVFCGDRNALL